MSTTINEYVKQSTDAFTIGMQDLNDDGDWDEYVDTLDQVGIDEYVQIYQQADEET